MIERVVIKNYKCIKSADIEFNSSKNILVGNNGVGKSTLIEAISLALGYGINTFEVTPYVFNKDSLEEYWNTNSLPEILIEIYFNGQLDETSGVNNSRREPKNGLYLRIAFDESYKSIFEAEKKRNPRASLPCELYKKERLWFSLQPVKQYNMPYIIQIADTSSLYFSSSSNQYVNQLIEKYLCEDDSVTIKSSLRCLKESFDQLADIKAINEKIQKEKQGLSLSIDVTSRIDRRDILYPFIEDIPVNQMGSGEMCHIKTLLALGRNSESRKHKITIIEEPESHLSHTKMYEMMYDIEQSIEGEDNQIFITTHNSFVANKLDLSNLIILENNDYYLQSKKLDHKEHLYKFFTKLSHYPTLRLILSKAVIFVEGPSDEMLVTYYYYKTHGHKHPFNDGIELITVDGTIYKEYIDLLSISEKPVAIITDNDGFPSNEIEDTESDLNNLAERRGLTTLSKNIRIFTEKNLDLKTLESSFVRVNANKLQELSDFIRGHKCHEDTESNLVDYMKKHKTDWSLKILENKDDGDFEVPEYIKGAVNWARNDYVQ